MNYAELLILTKALGATLFTVLVLILAHINYSKTKPDLEKEIELLQELNDILKENSVINAKIIQAKDKSISIRDQAIEIQSLKNDALKNLTDNMEQEIRTLEGIHKNE